MNPTTLTGSLDHFHESIDNPIALRKIPEETIPPTTKEIKHKAQKDKFEKILAGIDFSPRTFEFRKRNPEQWKLQTMITERFKNPKKNPTLSLSTSKTMKSIPTLGSRIFKSN